MSYESFSQYLLSSDNLIIDPSKLGLFMDMDKPLAHYFISSSHNTYLTGLFSYLFAFLLKTMNSFLGSQWNGRASTEMYRQVLLTGCRCIELDVVDSERAKDEPEIKHIHVPVTPVLFIEVIVAIREYAFKVTPYPLTLSIENHCG
jgi:phosphatidylinositol phospholipase C beta